jgi:hypothetical protein
MEQKHEAGRSMEQKEAWNKQKHGASRSMGQAVSYSIYSRFEMSVQWVDKTLREIILLSK